jgi:hypothetical protein
VRERDKVAGLCVGALVAAVLLFVFDPARSNLYPPCLFHAATGLYCPACGLARALHQLLHGHVVQAFGLNPAAVLFVPIAAGCGLSYAGRVLLGRAPRTWTIPRPAMHLLVACLVAFWVARNIPVYPFTLLAP